VMKATLTTLTVMKATLTTLTVMKATLSTTGETLVSTKTEIIVTTFRELKL